MSCHMFSGAYRIPAVSYEAVGVFTDETPASRTGLLPRRGHLALERAMDALARLSLDPVELAGGT